MQSVGKYCEHQITARGIARKKDLGRQILSTLMCCLSLTSEACLLSVKQMVKQGCSLLQLPGVWRIESDI